MIADQIIKYDQDRASVFYLKTDVPDNQIQSLRQNNLDLKGIQQHLPKIFKTELGIDVQGSDIELIDNKGTFHKVFVVADNISQTKKYILRVSKRKSADCSLLLDNELTKCLASYNLPVVRTYGCCLKRDSVDFDYQILEYANGHEITDLKQSVDFKQILSDLGCQLTVLHSIKGQGYGPISLTNLLDSKQGSDESLLSTSYSPRLAPKGTYRGVHSTHRMSGSRGQAAGSRRLGGFRKLDGNCELQGNSEHLGNSVHLGNSEHLGRKTTLLVGIHKTWLDYLFLNLDEHISYCLIKEDINSQEEDIIRALYHENSELLATSESSLLHCDLGNHNIFSSQSKISAIIDWEDAILGDPIFDLALWATFHPEQNYPYLLKSYNNEEQKLNSDEFSLKFWLYYLRVALAKTVHRHKFGYKDQSNSLRASTRIQKAIKYLKGHSEIL